MLVCLIVCAEGLTPSELQSISKTHAGRFIVPSEEPNQQVRAFSNQQARVCLNDAYIVAMKMGENRESNQTEQRDQLIKELHANRSFAAAVGLRYSNGLTGFAAALKKDALEFVLSRADVDYVECDHKWTSTAYQSLGRELWNLDRVSHEKPTLWTPGKIGSFETGALDGAGIDIYVLDTGINPDHIDFSGRLGAGKNFVDNQYTHLKEASERPVCMERCNSLLSIEWADCNGHGTHCAGIAAGSTYGVAKNATLHALRVLGCDGSGTWSSILGGLEYLISQTIASSRPSIASLSLGGTKSVALNRAVEQAVAAGVTMVVASGNENDVACNWSPASAEAVITVAASAEGDVLSSFSNYGACVDIVAPGTAILSTGMCGDEMADAAAGFSPPSMGSAEACDPRVDTSTRSGTSMACPMVAGAAALELQQLLREEGGRERETGADSEEPLVGARQDAYAKRQWPAEALRRIQRRSTKGAVSFANHACETLRQECGTSALLRVADSAEPLESAALAPVPLLTPAPTPSKCSTVAGADVNVPCVLPFAFGGKVYEGCTGIADKAGRAWCSTEVDADGAHRSGVEKWGYCGYWCDGARPLPTSAPTPAPMRDGAPPLDDENEDVATKGSANHVAGREAAGCAWYALSCLLSGGQSYPAGHGPGIDFPARVTLQAAEAAFWISTKLQSNSNRSSTSSRLLRRTGT